MSPLLGTKLSEANRPFEFAVLAWFEALMPLKRSNARSNRAPI